MPRARNPDSIEAERLWREEKLLLKEIAAKLGVPEGTVRRWKNTQDWEGKKSERSEKTKANVRKLKKGGQKGNENAKKHGAYASTRWDFLDPEERSWLEGNMHDDTEAMLLEEIAMYTIRERRIMNAINRYRRPVIDAEGREKPQEMYIERSVRIEERRRFRDADEEAMYYERRQDKLDRDLDRLPGDPYKMETFTAPTADIISRLEKELTTVQRSKTAALKLLDEVRQKRIENQRDDELLPLQKERIDAEIERLDAQTSKILGTNLELEDTTEADDLLYGSGMEVTADAPEAPDPEE